MLSVARRTIEVVLSQHVEDAALQRNVRSVLVRAPHLRLNRLQRLDERLAASLDGIAQAGDDGLRACAAALDTPGTGQVFTATVRAIEGRSAPMLDRLFALTAALPEARAGLVSAFGWVSAQSLRGITKALLDSPETLQRDVGLAACAMHGVNPGPALETALAAGASPVSTHAMRVAGLLGRVDLLPRCLAALDDARPGHRLSAARASVLLGDRAAAVVALQQLAKAEGAAGVEALQLLLRIAPPEQARAVLQGLAQDAAGSRALVIGTGVVGDAHYVPWLVRQMAEPALARVAGEAFSLITGLDLAEADLERSAPDEAAAGPNDAAGDDKVAMDDDESLPWPDAGKVAAWWQAQGSRFTPGTRHFLGQPVSVAHCLAALKTGSQRQRAAAAEHLCLLKPGTPLFNTAAPAWRQKRLLEEWTA